MRKGLFSKIALLLTGFISLVTTAGAYATWTYSVETPSDVQTEISVGAGVFKWEGSDDMTGTTLGTNHTVLVDYIINSEYGLNTSNSYLNQQIDERERWNRDTFGSVDLYDGQDIEELFDLNTSKLSFLIEFPKNNDKLKYIYTTSVDLGKSGTWLGGNGAKPNVPIGTPIFEVFRTTVELQNGTWVATKSEIGYANSAYYENNIAGSWVVQCPCFNPDTWKAGYLGTGFSNAIYAFVGQTASGYPKEEKGDVYYALKPSSGGTRTVTLAEKYTSCNVRVYDANRQLIAQKQTADAATLSWTATANAQYYIVIGGMEEFAFTIS